MNLSSLILSEISFEIRDSSSRAPCLDQNSGTRPQLANRPSVATVSVSTRRAPWSALLVDKHVPVSGHPVDHILDCIVSLFHGPLLNDGMNALLDGEVQHLPDLARGPNQRTGNGDAFGD